jgi:outer membrane biosynthesis protein TonB
MMISILALLILFGGGAALLGLIIFAIASKKPWILPVAGVLAAFALIAFGILPVVALAPHRSVTVQLPSPAQVAQHVNGMAHTVVQGPPNFNAYISVPNWTRILLIAFVLGLVVRRWMSPGAGHGLRRGWPAIAAILFIAVMFLGSVRSDYRVTQASNAAAEMAARQQITIANQGAHIASQVLQHLAQSDSQDIEQFDAPRIPIPPDITSANAPKAPVAPAQPTAIAKPTDQSASKSNKDDAKKPAAAPNHKRKKPNTTTESNDNKQAQPVAQSKPTDETAAKNEIASASDKPATAAEAKPTNSTSRPAWVDDPPKRTGDTRREVIATDPYSTVDECYQAADIYLLLKTYERMQQLIGRHYAEGPLPSLTFRQGAILADGKLMSYGRDNMYWNDADPRLRLLSEMGITADYVSREIVAKDPKDNESREYIETIESSVGPMKKLHRQVEFTPAIDRELRRHWDAHERRERFATVGIGAGSILGLLGLVFGLLKIDTRTKGYYTKRLFIGVPAAIIAGFLLLVTLVTHNATYR